jgi:competence protein ComGF
MRIQNLSKIKAFTLLEIMIALVLSFFIIGILYLSYNMMVHQFRNEYQKQLSCLVLLKSGLEMDFFYADSITVGQKQIFVFRSGKESSYQFNDDAILKEINLKSDTLFKGKCLTEIETIDKQNWVNRLILKIKVEDDEVRMSFHKCYRPNQILKNKEISFEY